MKWIEWVKDGGENSSEISTISREMHWCSVVDNKLYSLFSVSHALSDASCQTSTDIRKTVLRKKYTFNNHSEHTQERRIVQETTSLQTTKSTSPSWHIFALQTATPNYNCNTDGGKKRAEATRNIIIECNLLNGLSPSNLIYIFAFRFSPQIRWQLLFHSDNVTEEEKFYFRPVIDTRLWSNGPALAW